MRSFVNVAVLVVALGVAGCAGRRAHVGAAPAATTKQWRVETNYDKFRDRHNVTVADMRFTSTTQAHGEMRLDATFNDKGPVIAEPALVLLSFTRIGEEWLWLRSDDLTLMIGGERVPTLPMLSDDRVVVGSTVMEVRAVAIDRKAADDLAAGVRGEVQIGFTEGALPAELAPALRAMLATVGQTAE